MPNKVVRWGCRDFSNHLYEESEAIVEKEKVEEWWKVFSSPAVPAFEQLVDCFGGKMIYVAQVTEVLIATSGEKQDFKFRF